MLVLNDRYRIDDERPDSRLGQGGAAIVWRGEDLHLRQPVAIKLFTLNGPLTPEQNERFRAEARIAATLRHPSIITVTDYNVDAGRAYLVMELMEGGSLAHWLQREPRLVRQASLHIGTVLAEALAAAHAARHLHLDVKPANILFAQVPSRSAVRKDPAQAFLPKLSDFGAGRIMNGAGVSYQSTPLGTAAYTAPEQVRGQYLDERTDIYALGVVIYQMLCGELPFVGRTPELQLRQRLEEAPISLRDRRPELPIELCEVVMRAIERMPARRWASAQAFAEALRPFQAQADSETASPLRPSPPRSMAPSIVVPRPVALPPRPQRTTPVLAIPGAPDHLPHSLEELERDVVIPPSSVVDGAIYSHQGLHIHAHTIIRGTVFARGPIVLEAGCQVEGDITSLTSIEMAGGTARTLCAPTICLLDAVVLEGALLCQRLLPVPGTPHLPPNSAIEGPLVLDHAYAIPLEGMRGRPLQTGTVTTSAAAERDQAPVLIGTGCELHGIFGHANIVVAPRIRRLDTIRVSGIVELEGDSWVHTILGDSIILGPGTTAVYASALNELQVEPGASVQVAVSRGTIRVAEGAAIGQQLILSEQGKVATDPGATWADGEALHTEQHFTWNLYNDAPPGTLVLRTLTHALWRAYRRLFAQWFPALTPVEPDVPVRAPSPPENGRGSSHG